jgi:hypothetical protein
MTPTTSIVPAPTTTPVPTTAKDTDCGCGKVTSPVSGHPSGCQGDCADGSGGGTVLPNTPFEALRVAYGMLLGEEDFRVLMGHPRGKLMLHQSWLHGRGAVWGMAVEDQEDQLKVGPGLAVDGWGRELRLTSSWCVSVSAWAQRWLDDQAGLVDCETVTVHTWIVAEYDACDGRSVPALADPCDVNRRHDDYSRTYEGCRITMADKPPSTLDAYRRVRMLLGLRELTGDAAGHDVRDALDDLRHHSGQERAEVLLGHFRRLAAKDESELRPLDEEGDDCPPLPPVPEEEAGVVLAEVRIGIRAKAGCATVVSVEADPWVRPVLLPTQLIGELTCGLAPGLLGDPLDAGGPRLIRSSVDWLDDNSQLVFSVTKPIAPGSQEGGVEVSSLDDDGHGWSKKKIKDIHLSSDRRTVHVFLDGPPRFATARVLIRGTGRTSLFGEDPRVPFAGVEGGPPGTTDDGHDAVITERLPSSPAYPSKGSDQS